MNIGSLLLITVILRGLAGSVQTSLDADSKVAIRAGHFPNLTHAQAVVRQANGEFAKALGDEAGIGWKLFNSGTSAIEALFAGELDITYIGPNPAVNGHIKSAYA